MAGSGAKIRSLAAPYSYGSSGSGAGGAGGASQSTFQSALASSFQSVLKSCLRPGILAYMSAIFGIVVLLD